MRAQRGGGGHVDDVGRSALLEEDLDGSLAAEEHGALVGLVEHVVDFLAGLMYGQLAVEHAGVVDEDVEPAELLEADVEHVVDVLGLAHVGLQGEDNAGCAFGGDFIPEGFEALHAPGSGYDLGSLHGEHLRAGTANAGAGAGHDYDFVFEPHFFDLLGNNL